MQSPKSDFSFVEAMMMQNLAFRAILESMRLHLFDDLDNGPVHAANIAEKHGFQENPTKALLDLLAGQGILLQGPAGYANSLVASEHLVSTSPFYQGKALELHTRFNEFIQSDFLALLKGEADMRKSVDDGWGMEDNMTGTLQHARMGALQDTVTMVTTLSGLNESGMLCDIGGNHGEFSMSVLELYPDMTGEILDMPHVAEAANKRIAQRGYSERLQAVTHDLREKPLPVDRYDLILASHVLYGFVNELDNFARQLHSALRPGGWFVSHHLNPAGDLDPRYIATVQFITNVSGYSTHFLEKSKLESVLAAAGFTDIQWSPAGKLRGGLLLAGRKA